MSQLDLAKQAIKSEIARLAADQKHLEDVLAKLEGGSGHVSTVLDTISHPIDAVKHAVAAATGKKRGRPAGGTHKPKSEPRSDLDAALALIGEAGKDGIKALSLSAKLKKDGKTPPSKVELLEGGKVKSKGKGGGTTYILA